MMLSLDTAYRSFGGEVEASSTPTICRLSDSPRHQLSAIALISSSRRRRGTGQPPLVRATTSAYGYEFRGRADAPRNNGIAYGEMIRSRMAIITACVRVTAPSLSQQLLM